MAYNVEKVDVNFKELQPGDVKNYTYALLYRLSEVKLCKTEQLMDSDLKECIEARFFSEDRELHWFETEDGMCAVEVTDDGTTDYILKKYKLAPKFSGEGKILVVKEYLDYDKDGQAVVGLTRLAGLE